MFCTKCGSEVAPGRNFCSSCGTPVKVQVGAQSSAQSSAQPSARPNAEADSRAYVPQYTNPVRGTAPGGMPGASGFGGRCMKTIRNIGVNSNLYVGYIITMFFTWILVNSPLFAISMTGDAGSRRLTVGASYGFGQFSDILSLMDDFDEVEAIGGVMIFAAVVINIAILGSIVMALIPVLTGSRTSFAVSLVGIICTAISLLIFLVMWLIMAIGSSSMGSMTGGEVSVYFGPSLSGYWYALFAIVDIVLAAKVIGGLKKKRA